jgi:hypothetical protein
MPVPAALQVPLLLKVLTYDRNFGTRGESRLHVSIVAAPGDPLSARTGAEIASVLTLLSDKTVRRLQLTHATIDYTSDKQIAGALPENAVNVIYVTPGSDRYLADLVQVSHARQAITATGVPTYVSRGVAVGIGARQDRPEILINLAASKAAGSEFDAGLLRIASIIR